MAKALKCYASVDGTDCPIQKPSPFSSSFYSHKLNGAGLRYEMCVSNSSSRIFAVSGPYKAGDFPDLAIFKRTIKPQMEKNELVVADSGYPDDNCLQPLIQRSCFKRFHRRARGRHENLNSYFKKFRVLSTPFRHRLSFHGTCFHSIARITQIMLQTDQPI